MSPTCVLALVFALSTIAALINISNWNIEFSGLTTIYLISGMLVFAMTECVMSRLINHVKSLRKDYFEIENIYINDLLVFFAFFFELLMIFLMYKDICRITGTSGVQSLQIFRRYQMAANNGLSTRLSTYVVLLNRFMRAISYISIFVYINNSICSKVSRRKVILLVIGGYILFGCYMNSSRGELIRLITYTIIVAYCCSMNKYDWKKNLSYKFMKRGTMILMMFVPLFYMLSNLIHRVSKDLTAFDYMCSYIGGGIQCFNLYVQKPVFSNGALETMSGMQSLLLRIGVINSAKSTHMEFRWLTPTMHGNTYTFFRAPLHDFGYSGMLIFTAIVSFLFSYLYYGCIKRKKCSIFTIILYAYLFSWISMSSINQMSITFLSIGVWVEMVFAHIICRYFIRRNS